MQRISSLPNLLQLWHSEFQGYNRRTFQQDFLAGLTVGAVALPLALAFGVASGATPNAGLITAIVASIVITTFGGAALQVSGPTGAMSAILIGLASQHGIEGIWVASLLAGLLLILLGLFRLGRYITFIPAPVITGFTAGIALIIAIGQIDNILGVTTASPHHGLAKIFDYLRMPPQINNQALIITLIVVAIMIAWPRVTTTIPSSLIGIVAATTLTIALGWEVPTIGVIPHTLLLEQRLSFQAIPWTQIPQLLSAGVAIAALGAIESLLCGAVAKTMTGKPIDNDQELIGQGIGNLIIPFLGGVPATAAIARTSVAIKSGGTTRIVSYIHAAVLTLSVFLLGDVIGQIPLAALGGILLVTAWRMNEWDMIRFALRSRFAHALLPMIATMVATVVLDLTQAILIGTTLSTLIYLVQSTRAVRVMEVPINIQGATSLQGYIGCPTIHVYHLTGSLFFGSVNTALDPLHRISPRETIVLNLHHVALIDVMGIQALHRLIQRHKDHGGDVLLTNPQPMVAQTLTRAELHDIGIERFYPEDVEAIKAIQSIHRSQGCSICESPVEYPKRKPRRQNPRRIKNRIIT